MARKSIKLENLEKASPSGLVAEEIRKLITSGKLLPGKRLASERDLEKLFDVTRNAVRNGLQELEREGLIKCKGRSRTVLENSSGARMRSSQNNTIAILMDEVLTVQDFLSTPSSGWSNAISAGAVSEAFASGKSIFLVPTRKLDPEHFHRLSDSMPAGLVIVSSIEGISSRGELLKALKLRDVPITAYGDVHDWEGCDMVCSDHRQGSFDLTTHMISRGAKRILRVGVKGEKFRWEALREEGFKEACRKAGIPVLPSLDIPGDPSYDFTKPSFESEAHKMAGYLFKKLNGDDAIDTIMGVSDGFVFRIAAALRILGRDPGKFLIAGYDNYWKDLPDQHWETSFPVATVDKDNIKIGQELVKLMAKRIAGELGKRPVMSMVPQRLVVVKE